MWRRPSAGLEKSRGGREDDIWQQAEVAEDASDEQESKDGHYTEG